MSAIARNESGRWDKAQRKMVSWPWTINAQGQGMYFATKEEAVTAAQRLRMQGVTSMDVGCMQVNLMHHPNAFRNLNDAFEPEINVGYAAKFLHQNFEETGSWKTAIMYYHSRTPMYGVPYAQRVIGTWRSILNGDKPAAMAALEGSRSGGGSQQAASEYYIRRAGGIGVAKASSRARDVMVIRVADRSGSGVRNMTMRTAGAGGSSAQQFTREYTEVKPTSAQLAIPAAEKPRSGPKVIRVGGQAGGNSQKVATRTTPVDFIFD
jgi:hypothetical protein